MGYDMHTVIKPEGEERAVVKANEAFDAACAERNALPKVEAGQYQHGIDSFDGPNENASPRYKAAQRKVSAAYDKIREIKRSYFRLNVWGMGNVRTAMLDLGMAYDGAHELGCWPDYPGQGGTGANVAAEAMGDDADPREYAAKYYAGLEITDADIAEATAYHEQAKAFRKEHPPGGETIPVHKFGSNDGWIVTPRECLNALAVWHATPEGMRIDAFEKAGMTDPDWGRTWKRWLAFLELAAHCDGFEVW
jgi:hypothetical protein